MAPLAGTSSVIVQVGIFSLWVSCRVGTIATTKDYGLLDPAATVISEKNVAGTGGILNDSRPIGSTKSRRDGGTRILVVHVPAVPGGPDHRARKTAAGNG